LLLVHPLIPPVPKGMFGCFGMTSWIDSRLDCLVNLNKLD
jgi:hypothetical protein